jgi:hypothetical protein
MRRTVRNGENGIRWKFTSKLDDLDFADDIALLSFTKQQMQYKLNKLDAEARRVGLKINVKKTKMMRINPSSQEQFTIGTQDRIEVVKEFSYLGATVCKDGGGMKDLNRRLQQQMSSKDNESTVGRPCVYRGTPAAGKLQIAKQRREAEEMEDDWTHFTARQI